MRAQNLKLSLCLAAMAVICLSALPAISQDFPKENFTPVNPTVPNSKLNFDDDSRESCCARDYVKPGTREYEAFNRIPQGTASANATQERSKVVAGSDFEKNNPKYFEAATPLQLVECEKYAQYPISVSNGMPDVAGAKNRRMSTLPIGSYSTSVSNRIGAEYMTDPAMRNTSDFHIEAGGGSGVIRLTDVNSYSVCMARGNNVALVANTDNGSIVTYNGNDHVLLAGNNTNMIARTGGGNDVLEVRQAMPLAPNADGSESWMAYNVFKTALSGGEGDDTVVIGDTPKGTKWCHIGGYKIAGEYFFVVEFALPPSVKEGPRRQRINIGKSVEYVVIKGKRFALNEFLTHGTPIDTVARSVPVTAPLAKVKTVPASTQRMAMF